MIRRACGIFLLVGALVPWFACSEDTQKPPGDTTAPELTVFVPYDSPTLPFVVSDSVDVWIGAHDVGADGASGAVAGIEVFARPMGAAEPLCIGEATAPIPLDSVPEPLREHVELPSGWQLYRLRWYTSWYQPSGGTPIHTGTYLRLFATAEDLAGNRGTMPDSIAVVVVNTSDFMPFFDVVFLVSPVTASAGEPFSFDPTPTSHPWLPDSAIAVRWDFDGDPENGWDLDWGAGARADRVVTRSFDRQGIYLIRLQARDPFLPDSVFEAMPRRIRVLPFHGDPPPPPDPENYRDVPAGLYPISEADSVHVIDGARTPVDASELPPHSVWIEQPFAISRYEVTNRLYLRYLERELQQEQPNLQFNDGEIRERLSGGASGKLYCRLSASRIFFDLDQERFAIEAGFDEHPVTGVTWYGAEAYASAYGLRLPTEAEWEVAGRGAAGELDYPFPGGIDPSLDEARHRMNIVDTFSPGDPFDDTTTPVGYFNGTNGTTDTRSEFGLYDLSGNVAEWVSDWYGPYEAGTAYSPTGPTNGTDRVARGGGYTGTRVDCRATARRAYDPEACSRAIGFRCAFDVIE